MSARAMHDINVIGSLQLLAACEQPPTIRAIVIRGSAGIYGAEPNAPQFFTEEMTPPVSRCARASSATSARSRTTSRPSRAATRA